jgi:hypothetical protein
MCADVGQGRGMRSISSLYPLENQQWARLALRMAKETLRRYSDTTIYFPGVQLISRNANLEVVFLAGGQQRNPIPCLSRLRGVSSRLISAPAGA